jgi:hypothetical protein
MKIHNLRLVEAAGVELIHAIENMKVKDSMALGNPPRPPFLSMVSRFVTAVPLKHAEEKKLQAMF